MSTMHLNRAEFGRRKGPPPDPVMLGAQGKRRLNYNSATGKRLFRTNHMPIGRHAGKIMKEVPADYLLKVRTHYPQWPKTKRALWFPVWDYIDRELEFIQIMAETQESAPPQAPLPRLRGTLVDPATASKTASPRFRCELCHDDETVHPKCECDATTRRQRNLQRRCSPPTNSA